MPLLEALPELAGQGFDTLLDRVMATGQPFVATEMPARLAHLPEGEQLIANFVYTPKRDAEGKVDGVLVSASDVTELVKARRATEASSARFEAMFNSLPDGTFLGDETGILRVNAAGLELIGVEESEILGAPPTHLQQRHKMLDATTGQPLTAAQSPLRRALSGEVVRDEYIIWNPRKGRNVRLRTVASPIRVGGAITSAVILHSDITEQHRALEALHRSEESFRTFAETLPDTVWTADGQGRILWTNGILLRSTGLSSEQILGEGYWNLIHPGDQGNLATRARDGGAARKPASGAVSRRKLAVAPGPGRTCPRCARHHLPLARGLDRHP